MQQRHRLCGAFFMMSAKNSDSDVKFTGLNLSAVLSFDSCACARILACQIYSMR